MDLIIFGLKQRNQIKVDWLVEEYTNNILGSIKRIMNIKWQIELGSKIFYLIGFDEQ